MVYYCMYEYLTLTIRFFWLCNYHLPTWSHLMNQMLITFQAQI